MDQSPYTGIGRGYRALTGAGSITRSDLGLTVACTSGTFTVSLAAAVLLQSGFHCTICNPGTGIISIDPDGSEIIRTSSGSADKITLKQGESVILMCDGVGLFVIGDSRTIVLDIRDFGAVGNGTTDDSVAIQAAIDRVGTLGDGTVFIPGGTHICGDLTFAANVRITGVGPDSILKFKSGSTYLLSANPGTGGTTNPANNMSGIGLSRLTLRGLSDTAGFSQFTHLLNLNAVSDVLVDDCDFLAPQGDGIYLGSSNTAGVERHNERVTIRKCRFNGIGKENRNGISVIDCTGLLVEDCYFTDITKSTMPGAIDIEPDAYAFARLRNITIRTCRFSDVGGNFAAFGVYLPLAQSALTTPVQDIVFDDCFAVSCANGITVKCATAQVSGDVPHQVIVQNCHVELSSRGIDVENIKGMRIIGNWFVQSQYSALIGYSTGGYKVWDIDVIDNHWFECGTTEGYGLSVFASERVKLERNEFQNCGKTDNSLGVSLDFNTGTSLLLSLIDNRVIPGARGTASLIKEAGHTFTPSGNVMSGNDWGGGSCQFQSLMGDMLGWKYAALTGTYTVIPADRGTTFDVTSGTFSINLTASATFTAGFHASFYNSGSGTATIDPAGTETIRSPSGTATTFALAQGQGVTIVTDGSNWDIISSVGIPGSPSTAIAVRDNAFTITGNVDTTKQLVTQVDTQGTGLTTTLDVGAQTGSRTFTLPVTSGNDTLAALSIAQTFTATQTMNRLVAAQTLSGGTNLITIQNSSTSGYSAIDFNNTSGTQQMAIGFGNSAVAATVLRNINFVYIGSSADYVIFTNGTEAVRVASNQNVTLAKRLFAGTIGSTFSGNVIAGVQDGTVAVSGQSGEVLSAIVSTYTNFTTTVTYQAITSLLLTKGDWVIEAMFTYDVNGATITAGGNAIFLIGTTSASAAGATEGLDIAYIDQNLVAGDKHSGCIVGKQVNVSADTTYYLNAQAAFTIGNPRFVGSLLARRLR